MNNFYYILFGDRMKFSKKFVVCLLIGVCSVAYSFVDSNGNGMDDIWEQQNGVNDPYADEDGDDIANIFEYLASLNPHINNSDPDDNENFTDIIPLHVGWNLISLPELKNSEMTMDELFTSEHEGIWCWDSVANDYVNAAQEKPFSKVGYWVFSLSNRFVSIERKKSAEQLTTITYKMGAMGSIVSGYLEQSNDGKLQPPVIEPNWGYEFTGWSFKVDPNNLNALIAEAQYEYKTYQVTYDAGVLGTITSGEPVQTVQPGKPPVDPVITPVAGQQFIGWFQTINSDDDVTMTAVYRPENMVVISAGTNTGENYSLTVDEFFMDSTEVSKSQWDVVASWAESNGYDISAAGGFGKAENHPVQTVTWYECVKWCNARSEKEGLTPCYTFGADNAVYKAGEDSSVFCNLATDGYRLPSSDEWQYAARGGHSDKRYPWGTDLIDWSNANYKIGTNYHPNFYVGVTPYTSPVISFVPNSYGLYNMSGNVWEWVNDENSSGSKYCFGGSWSNTGYDLRCSHFVLFAPGSSHISRGFRSVRTAKELAASQ